MNVREDFSRIGEALLAARGVEDADKRLECARSIARDMARAVGRAYGMSAEEMARLMRLPYEKVRGGGVVVRPRRVMAEMLDVAEGDIPPVALVAPVAPPVEAGGVRVEEVGLVLVPPDGGEMRREGGGRGYEKVGVVARLAYAVEALESVGIAEDARMVVRGGVTDRMMRREPYVCVIVPDLGRTVLLCEEEDNRTFVFGVVERGAVLGMAGLGKEELKARGDVLDCVWTGDGETWKVALLDVLTAPLGEGVEVEESGGGEEGVEREGRMDAEYF